MKWHNKIVRAESSGIISDCLSLIGGSLLKISVCDNNREFLQLVGSLLRQDQMIGSSVITYYTNPDWLIYDVTSHESAPDILIININLIDRDGIEIAKTVSSIVPSCRIILTCEKNKVEPRCFEVNHCFILPKELLPAFLKTAIEKAVLEWRSQNTGTITVISNRSHMILPSSTIIFLEKQHRKTIVVLNTESIETYQSPQSLLNNVQSGLFLQCHKSYYPNVKHIRLFSRGGIVMDNGAEIPVGRSYYDSVLNQVMASMNKDNIDYRR